MNDTLDIYKMQLSKKGELYFSSHITPNAKKTELKEIVTENIEGKDEIIFRIRVQAPPVEGKANKELKKYLAKVFDVHKNNITIISGEHGRKKLIRVHM